MYKINMTGYYPHNWNQQEQYTHFCREALVQIEKKEKKNKQKKTTH